MQNLRKFLPLLVLVLGLGLVFTQSAFKSAKRLGYTFYYNGPDFTVNEVTTESNWVYDANDNECSAVNDQACSIKILDVNLVEPDGTSYILKDDANLTATLSTYSTARITGSDDDDMEIFNEAHP